MRAGSARVLAAALLACLPAAGDAAAQFEQFLKFEIAGRWPKEEVSEQRVVLLRGFAKHDVPAAAEWLLTEALGKDPAGDVKREAVRVLSTYRKPDTVARMLQVWKKGFRKNWEARALALLAFGKIKDRSAEQALALGLEDKDPRVVIVACRAAGEGNRFGFTPRLLELARHKDRLVRGAALLALGIVGGDEALPVLFHHFCTDKSNRARYDAWLALRKLALEPDLACDPDKWREFWERRMMEVPEGEPNPWGKSFPRLAADYGKPGDFFGMPILADRVAFVLDISLDMDNPWPIDLKAERKKPRDKRIPNLFSVKTRWDLVSAYIGRCLAQMSPRTEVCFVFFNDKIRVFPDKGRLLRNKPRTREKILAQLKEIKRGGSTAMYAGLKAGWGFVKGGKPRPNFLKGADTIIFVTDGQPTFGELKDRPDRLRAEAWRVGVPRNLRIFTVGLYYHAYELLKGLAKDSGGLYVHAQPAGDTTEPQDLDFWPKKKKAFEEARRKKRTPGPKDG